MENCAYLRKNPGYAPDIRQEMFTVKPLSDHRVALRYYQVGYF